MLALWQQLVEWLRKYATPIVIAEDRFAHYAILGGQRRMVWPSCPCRSILTAGCDVQLVLQARNGARDDRPEQSW